MTGKKMIKVKVFRIELDNPPVGERVFAVDVITRKLVYDYLDKLSHSELPMGLVVCSDTTAIKIGTKCHVEGHNDDINAIHTCIGFTENGDVEMDNGLPYKKDKTHAVIGAYPYVDNIARVHAHFIPKWLADGRMETYCEYSMQDNELRPSEENGFLNLELKDPDAESTTVEEDYQLLIHNKKIIVDLLLKYGNAETIEQACAVVNGMGFEHCVRDKDSASQLYLDGMLAGIAMATKSDKE